MSGRDESETRRPAPVVQGPGKVVILGLSGCDTPVMMWKRCRGMVRSMRILLVPGTPMWLGRGHRSHSMQVVALTSRSALYSGPEQRSQVAEGFSEGSEGSWSRKAETFGAFVESSGAVHTQPSPIPTFPDTTPGLLT